jgi:small GTP-binding protein
MSDEPINIETWQEYLDDLYQWIQEKYQLFEMKTINEAEYNEHLEYYLKEKERIETIIDESIKNIEEEELAHIDDFEEDESKRSAFLNQERFEEFFGVKINDELKRIKQEEFNSAESPKSVEETEKIWQIVTGEQTSIETPVKEVEEPQLDNEMSVNILLIGDSAVGRTSLRRAWMGKHFIENHLTTIGASIEKKTIVMDNFTYNITLTDLGGQDFYSGLRRNFYRNIDAAIIVFDLTRADTFRRLDFWVKEMYREIKRLVPFMIVGNKMDSKNRQIPEKYGIRASAKYSRTTLPRFRVRYMETSAKSGTNVNEIFDIMCREIRDLKFPNQKS